MLLVVAVSLAVLFYMMAQYEHHAGWVWAGASLALSTVVLILRGGPVTLVIVHGGLYGVLWWYNGKQLDARHQAFLGKRAEQKRLQEERWRRAREEIDADQRRANESPPP